MRGKPIEQITIADLEQLISDSVAEDRRLEFKVDIPMSSEEQKRQRLKVPNTIPLDRSWINGRGLQDYGRDALAEEIVAFANSDGGTLILGMDETSEAPPRAIRLNALPDVAGLERRLRDVLLSCVEPRLPYVAVRALQTDANGSGIILIETSSSIIGPHWVVKTRRPTIRREDRCVPLSMPEVHEMVLRNARSVDTALTRLEKLRDEFEEIFISHLDSQIPYAHLRHGRTDVEDWLEPIGQAALGAQVIIMPHNDLSLPRFETMTGLMPADDAISVWTGDTEYKQQWIDAYSMLQGYEKRVLNGVSARQKGGFDKFVKILRNGQVEVSFIQHKDLEKCTCSADLIVTIAGFALGVYDRLRARSSYPEAPAEIAVDLCTCRHVGVGRYSGFGFPTSYGKLDENVRLDRYTFGETADISLILQEIASDLYNAGGQPASNLPRVEWCDPR